MSIDSLWNTLYIYHSMGPVVWNKFRIELIAIGEGGGEIKFDEITNIHFNQSKRFRIVIQELIE